MTARALLILPVLCVPAWYAGRQTAGGKAGSSVPATPSAAEVRAANPVPQETEWEKLSKLPPSPENRWRALSLFDRWVETDPLTAAKRLAALPESGCALWSNRGALEAFMKVWAAKDADAAWKAAQDDPLKSQRDTLAAFRVDAHFAEMADDNTFSDSIRNLAKAKLAAENPAEAHRRGWLKGDVLNSALLGGSDPVARWREVQALGVLDFHAYEAFQRLMIRSRSDALALAQDGVIENKQLQREAREALTLTASGIEELKAVPGDDRSYARGRAMAVWDLETLHNVLRNPPPPEQGRNDSGRFLSMAAAELLSRDPAALLPYIQQWQNDGTAKELNRIIGHEYPSAEYAAQVRALVEAVPPEWQKKICISAMKALEEFEPAFLIGQVEKHGAGSDTKASEPGLYATGLIGRWLQSDTPAATEWLKAHPAALTAYQLEETVKNWVGFNPEAASGWIESMAPGAQRDSAIRGLVQQMKTHDPAAASAWAAKVQDQAGRKSLQDEIMEQWRLWDPNAKPVE